MQLVKVEFDVWNAKVPLLRERFTISGESIQRREQKSNLAGLLHGFGRKDLEKREIVRFCRPVGYRTSRRPGKD